MDGQTKDEVNPPVALSPGEADGKHPEEEVFALAAKVFGNHLLREAIVDYAIHQADGSLDRSSVFSLRAVARDWNDSVCKLLHKSAEPLFEIYLDNRNTLNGIELPQTSAEFLNQFTETFGSSADVFGRTPTYQLSLRPNVFRRENYESLNNFLVACGSGLVRINFHIPRNGGSMSGIFPNLELPSLRAAIFGLDDTRFKGRIRHEGNMTYLLESIFSGAPALKELTMSHYSGQPYPPSVFENVVLPPSLEQVVLWGEISNGHLLVKNPLPNLTSLELQLSDNLMPVGFLTMILEKVRWTLKSLSLQDYSSEDDSILFRFPVMEKLEIFDAFSSCCVLEPGIRSLETFLPKLRKLRFANQSSDIRQWTNGSRFSSVEQLYISFGDGAELSFNPELVSQIHLAFPNVTNLQLVLVDMPVAGVHTMFMQMTSLMGLSIKVEVPEDEIPVPVDWDSVLIGKAPGFAAALREKLPLWEKIQINDDDPSVRKLTELRTLSIDDSAQDSLLSDVAFHYGFLKMPLLQELEFSGRFSVSPEMVEKWETEGRILYFPE